MREQIALAQRMADTARAIVRGAWLDVQSTNKSDGSPVTVYDQQCERRLREMVLKSSPQAGFIGEEYGSVNEGADQVWVVDPIDGTRPFTAGLPTFTTLIALRQAGEFVLGVIEQPILGTRWLAVRGRGCLRDGARVQVRECPDLASAALQTSGPLAHAHAWFSRMEPLHRQANVVVYEGDGLGFGILASGGLDVVVDANLKLYDIAAPLVVLEEAGATVTDWRGRPVTSADYDGTLLAAGSARVHAQALEHLA
jgi:inositol-phosphate phosphatase/L-galactose 1-phosphate phosphatase/histidinol-phosphatase